jgi:hypothetical protein
MTPAATARSCVATHLARLAGSGVGVRCGPGDVVAGADDRVALGGGGSVVLTVAGAAQDTSISARRRRGIPWTLASLSCSDAFFRLR